MKIRKNGWICRLAYTWFGDEPGEKVNLCQLVFRLILAFCLLGAMMAVAVGAVMAWREAPASAVSGLWKILAIGLGVAVGFLSVVMAITGLIVVAVKGISRLKRSEVYLLILAHLKAKKEKVCPIIEVVD